MIEQLPHLPRTNLKAGPATAFSLVEMLIATSLLAAISVGIFSILNLTSGISTQTTARLNAATVARDCLDLIGKDLSVARLPMNRNAYDSYQLVINPASVTGSASADATTFLNPHIAFWQIPAAQATVDGDASIVGFFVLRDLSTDPKKNRLQLRRVLRVPEPAGSTYDFRQASDSDGRPLWVTNALLEEYGPLIAQDDLDNGLKGWVADGVLAMWVRALDVLGDPITKDGRGTDVGYAYDSRAGFQSENYRTQKTDPYNANLALRKCYNALPAYIEVALVCIAPQDQVKIRKLPDYPTTPDPLAFETEISDYVAAVKAANPGLVSIGCFSRRFRIYNSN